MSNPQDFSREIEALEWYHTIDLGNGVLTPGHYDLRAYLKYYGLPADLTGKSVIDIGAASGFFSFEMEKRGARVTATDLPSWTEHDFAPVYQADKTPEQGMTYLHQPFRLAKHILGSAVERREINIYDISPETVGKHDIAFCASVLLHLSDPIKALWRIQSVTREYAIIATPIHEDNFIEPLAYFFGQHSGDVWWFPNRACLEAMLQTAGFNSCEWVSEFRLDYRSGQPGAYHGVVRAWNIDPYVIPSSGENLLPARKPPQSQLELEQSLIQKEQEITALKNQVRAYQQRTVVRLADRIAGWMGGRLRR